MEETNFRFVMIALRDMEAELHRLRGTVDERTTHLQRIVDELREEVGQLRDGFQDSTDKMLSAVSRLLRVWN